MVERYVPGNEHRLLVVGDRLAAAARGEPAYVTADGIASIRQLVDTQLNTDPLRSSASNSPLNLVSMDSMTRQDLAQQGYEPDSIPAAGTRVLIQRNGNVCFDCTALVHPETARLAILAARIVGLDIAGVDLVAEDVSKTLTEQRGAIVEVNAGPGLGYHIVPPGIPPSPVGAAIIKHLFPTDDTGRIPVIGVAGTGATTGTARVLAHLLQLSGQHVGLACCDGLFLGTRRIDHRDSANWRSGQRLLVNRTLQTAVIENGVRALLDEGLAYDRCHIGVVTKLDQSGLVPERHIDTDDALFKVIRTQVDVVLRDGFAVLNAADTQIAAMAELCDGQIMYFSADPNAAPLTAHVRDQGRAVVLRGGFIVLMHGPVEIARLRAGSADLSSADPAGDDTISLLAAVAAAWASGLQVVQIQAGLETREPSHHQPSSV
jgi:cyanophycin synthetase